MRAHHHDLVDPGATVVAAAHRIGRRGLIGLAQGAVDHHQRVVAGVAAHAVLARAADEHVVAVTAGQGVVPCLAEDEVGAAARVDAVVARAGQDVVSCRAAGQRVVAVAALDAVGLGGPTGDAVMPRFALERVALQAPGDRVVAVAAADLVVAADQDQVRRQLQRRVAAEVVVAVQLVALGAAAAVDRVVAVEPLPALGDVAEADVLLLVRTHPDRDRARVVSGRRLGGLHRQPADPGVLALRLQAVDVGCCGRAAAGGVDGVQVAELAERGQRAGVPLQPDQQGRRHGLRDARHQQGRRGAKQAAGLGVEVDQQLRAFAVGRVALGCGGLGDEPGLGGRDQRHVTHRVERLAGAVDQGLDLGPGGRAGGEVQPQQLAGGGGDKHPAAAQRVGADQGPWPDADRQRRHRVEDRRATRGQGHDPRCGCAGFGADDEGSL